MPHWALGSVVESLLLLVRVCAPVLLNVPRRALGSVVESLLLLVRVCAPVLLIPTSLAQQVNLIAALLAFKGRE